MADKFVFSNFAVSTLSEAIGADDITLQLNIDDVDRFPLLTGGAKFPLILADDDDNVEIVYVINLSATGLAAVERGREGTQALGWLAGTVLRHTMTAATVIAAAGLRPMGTWNAGVQYTPGDLVVQLGISYIAVNGNIGSAPSGANANWQVVYQPSGVAGTSLTWQDRWSSTTSYSIGHLVERAGLIWQSTINSNLASIPAPGNANWVQVARWGSPFLYLPVVVATGGPNNYVATLSLEEGPKVLYDGLTLNVRFPNTNTGTCTLAVVVTGGTSFAAKAMRKVESDPTFVSGDIRAGELYQFTFDQGADCFRMVLPPVMMNMLASYGTRITALEATAAGAIPVGTIWDFGGLTAPAGWLKCEGQIVAQASYPSLYSTIGGLYNVGAEGVGNFRLPDFRGRVSAGPDAGTGRSPLTGTGQAGGGRTAALAIANLPAHTHTVGTQSLSLNGTSDTAGDHTHAYTAPGASTTGIGAPTGSQFVAGVGATTGNGGLHAHTVNVSGTLAAHSTDSTGTGAGFEIFQPTLCVTKIIKT